MKQCEICDNKRKSVKFRSVPDGYIKICRHCYLVHIFCNLLILPALPFVFITVLFLWIGGWLMENIK